MAKKHKRGDESRGGRLIVDRAETQTSIDIDRKTRSKINEVLSHRLSDTVDLQSHLKQAHWNVRGPSFQTLHELFDDITGAIGAWSDLIAERIRQLGGEAIGTTDIVAAESSLEPYPIGTFASHEHIEAVASRLARYGSLVRAAIDEASELKDSVTADILTGITRDLDKWLWFVDSHREDAVGTKSRAK